MEIERKENPRWQVRIERKGKARKNVTVKNLEQGLGLVLLWRFVGVFG
jgi:hypothetical protein